jgi:hypothetical protein
MSLPIKSSQENCNTDSALSTASPTGRSQQASSWRSWLRVHPAADDFPLLKDTDPAALKVLADDIKRHRQREPATYIIDESGRPLLLDGRNQLDARESAGLKIDLADRVVFEQLSASIDATAFVISKNLHRRHLTPEWKSNYLAGKIKANPGKSARAIAAEAGKDGVKVDKNTVIKKIREMQATGEASPVEKTVGKDGKARKQPAKKAPKINPEGPTPAVTSNPNPPVVHHGGRPEDRVVIEFICKRLTKEDVAHLLSLMGGRHVLLCSTTIAAVISDSEATPSKPPAEEPGADGRPQLVFPGMERRRAGQR